MFMSPMQFFGFKTQLNAPFMSKSAKTPYFPMFCIGLYRRTMEIFVFRYPNPLPHLPDIENWHRAF